MNGNSCGGCVDRYLCLRFDMGTSTRAKGLPSAAIGCNSQKQIDELAHGHGQTREAHGIIRILLLQQGKKTGSASMCN